MNMKPWRETGAPKKKTPLRKNEQTAGGRVHDQRSSDDNYATGESKK